MTIQLASDISVRIARESTTGTAALVGATPCHVVRITDSPGLEKKTGQIQSMELRDDAQKTMGRLGAITVDGSYNGELTVGGAVDMFIEAIMRSTWAASSLLFTADGGAAHTSIAFTANTATLAGTDTWTVTHGVKKGDVMRFGAVGATVDNINCLVIGVAAQVLTFAGTPLAVVAADANATATRLKKVITPATPTRWSHTVEQYDENIDLASLFVGCRVVGLKLSYKPNEMAKFTVTLMGMDRTLLVTGTSPWFTTPTTTTGLGLVSDDSTAWVAGAAALYITGFDLDFAIAAEGVAVLGARVTPDVFDNICTVSGTITGLRASYANPILYDAETEFDVGILLQEPGAVPRGCLSIYIPRAKISALSVPVGGSTGPKVESMTLMVGPAVAATGLDATIANFGSSAA